MERPAFFFPQMPILLVFTMDSDTAQKVLGYTFSNPELLQRSLTHRSWAHETMFGADEATVRSAENESLEFVGDSVLGLIAAERLFELNPGIGEGGLTLMKHHLVSTTTLARIGESLGIGEFLRVGKGEERSGGRKKPALIADAVEAVIAAIFLDGGYLAARDFVLRAFGDEFKNASPCGSLDFKTLLQETLQAKKFSAPVYRLVKTEGMPHARTFSVEAEWENGKSLGSGKSIKAAEMMAADEALRMLKENENTAE